MAELFHPKAPMLAEALGHWTVRKEITTWELRMQILAVTETWTDEKKKYVEPSLDYSLAASCVDKGNPAGATSQKSDTLPAATAPTQRMLNASYGCSPMMV